MQNNKQTIMIVDDDPNIARLIKLYLEKENYLVSVQERGDDAINAFNKQTPDLVLLDIMLPGMDGWEVCRRIRANHKTPIIMLTAKDDTFDKVLGLELGADDYVTKPFDSKELVARVKAVLRRAAPEEQPAAALTFPNLSISLAQYEVLYNGNVIDMPPKELEVLHFLASHKNQVFTREQLLEQVWDFDFFGDSRTLDVHIKRLREKLQGCEEYGWQIRTVWGVGYKFEVK